MPERWADIPLLNVFTWNRSLRLADERNKWKYVRLPGYTHPRTGDVVVFNSPLNPHLMLVKRITHIVKKGDTLRIDKKSLDRYCSIIQHDGGYVSRLRNRILINGRVDSVYVPKREYYYMEGDNKEDSQDSRFFGFVPEEAIVGKFDFVLFSIDPEKGFWKGFRPERFLKGIN